MRFPVAAPRISVAAIGKTIAATGFTLAAMVFASCADSVDSVYANYRASFNFTPVTAVSQLHQAVNNPGLFCLVWRDTGQYYFQNAAGSTGTYPVTAADAYTTWQCLSGFIVGTTNVPDLSSGQLSLVAYDAVCPNCFSESTIQRRLTFADEGTAHCTRCDRDYDLNNFGIVTQGGAGRSLFRYRVYYAADRLVVNN